MTAASLSVLLLLGQISAAEPSDLIAQLGSSHYAEREAASSALERLGRRSMPALRAACERRDAEVRARAAAILTRIEGAMLTEPSQVTLDFQDVPLAEVLRSFSGQAGVKLTLLPENSPTLLGRKVTVHEGGPLPFWKAIDRLCEAGHLQYNFGMNAFPNGREAAFPLFEGGVRLAAPVSDSGPFRVSVVAVHYQSDVSFPPAPQFARNGVGRGPAGRGAAKLDEQFYAQLQVAGEPRLSLIQNAPLRILEAVDDRGNQLVIPSAGGPDLRRSGYFGFGTGSVIQIQAAMARPQKPGTMIKRLKGVVPLTVSTRKPKPLVVPLGGASGRTFQNDEATITVHAVRSQPADHVQTIEVTIRPHTRSDDPSDSGFGGNEAHFVRPDAHQQQVEVTDASGRPIPWYQSSVDSEAGRVTLALTTPAQAATAAELRYYSLVRATTEVPFVFADVPMP